MDEVEKTVNMIKKEEDVFAKARLIRYLLRDKGMKVMDLAKKLRLTSSYVCHFNRLNNLPEIVVDGYYSKLISIGHLFLISRLKKKEDCIRIYEAILKDNFTINQTEEMVRDLIWGVKTKGEYLTMEKKENYEKQISHKYSDITLKIRQTKIRGRLVFEILGDLEKSSKIIKEILSKIV